MVIKPSSENADKLLLRNGNTFLTELHLSTIYFKISTFFKFFSQFKFTKILFKASSKSFAVHVFVFILSGIIPPVTRKGWGSGVVGWLVCPLLGFAVPPPSSLETRT